jgi:hypothetical protein
MTEPSKRDVPIDLHALPAIPLPAADDVDYEPLTEAEIAALAANDGTYVALEDLIAEFNL